MHVRREEGDAQCDISMSVGVRVSGVCVGCESVGVCVSGYSATVKNVI